MNIGSTCVGRVPALQAGLLGWMLPAKGCDCKLTVMLDLGAFAAYQRTHGKSIRRIQLRKPLPDGLTRLL